MTVMKKFSKGLRPEYILGIIALVFVGLALYKYSGDKNMYQSPMTPGPSNLGFSDVYNNAPQNQGTSQSFNGQQNTNAMDIASSNSNLVLNKQASNPSDLLPSDMNNSWANLNPVGNADLKNINLLNPTQLTGINTQGSSLRNPNLQLRSEPPNPRTNTNCPWNISTIEADQFRKILEIGS
jgi:hypothetical protein